MAFLGAIGLVGTIAGIILIINALIKKSKKRPGGIVFIASFILFVIAIAMTPTQEETTTDNELVETSAPVNSKIKSNLTIQEYENRLTQAFKEMGNKTRMKIVSSELQDGGRTLITLSEHISITLTTNNKGFINEALLTMSPDAYYAANEDFDFSFLLLVGTVDNSLSFGGRHLLIRELGLDDDSNLKKSYTNSHLNNGIKYTYNGNPKDNFNLLAEFQ